MQRLHFHADPKLSGTPYGFEEKNLNGLRLLTMGGDSVYFHSILALIPEKGTGMFVAYNSSSALQPHEQVLQPFLDRFFPAPVNFRSSGDSSDAVRARMGGHS